MNLLGAALYDPAVAVSKATSALLAMTAFDTTNLRLTVTVPAHGMLRIRMVTTLTGATTVPTILLGVLNSTTVVGRQTPLDFPGTMNAATQSCPCIADFIVTGLTPGSITLDAAYAVQVIVASTNIKYGGPNTNAGANAWGAFSFEIYDPRPMTLALDGGVNVKQWNGTNVATPATAGIPDVNVKNMNNVSAASITTINANMGSTQPVNFTGSGATALLKSDTVDWNGTAVAAPATAGIPEVNVKNINNVSTSPVTIVKAVQGLTTADTIATYTGNTPQTGDAFTRIGVAGVGLTNLGDTRIAHLDADVSSRSTYAGGAVASVTAAVTVGTNNDKTGYALSAAGVQAIWDALTSVLTTVGSIGKLLVTNIDAAISSRSTYAGGDTSGVTTLLSRLTGTRATNLDNLDATVSSRLASASYTAPDNANIATIAGKLPVNNIADENLVIAATTSILSDTGAIKAKTNNLPASPAATSDIPTANITAIKAKTDALTFTKAGEVDSNIHSVNGTGVSGDGKTGTEWGPSS
jgi:hypothetical protein